MLVEDYLLMDTPTPIIDENKLEEEDQEAYHHDQHLWLNKNVKNMVELGTLNTDVLPWLDLLVQCEKVEKFVDIKKVEELVEDEDFKLVDIHI